MDAMDSDDESEDENMSTEMLEDIRHGSQSHMRVNRWYAHYKICDHIKQIQSEWKGLLKAIRNMGKFLHKSFKNSVKEILQDIPILGESGWEVSYFILKTTNVSEVNRFSDEIKEPCLKLT